MISAVINVWNKELHINVRLNQTMRLINLRNIQWLYSFLKILKVRFLKIRSLFVDMLRLMADINEGIERKDYSLEIGGTETCDYLDAFPKING